MHKDKSFLFKDKMFYSAYVISSEICRSVEGKEFVEYTIKVTILYENWLIKRRFSDFKQLNALLKPLIPDMPSLPSKKFFFNCSQAVIQNRIEMFDVYLSFLIKQINFLDYDIIIDFLEVKQSILIQIHPVDSSSRDSSLIESLTSFEVINNKSGVLTKKSQFDSTAMTNTRTIFKTRSKGCIQTKSKLMINEFNLDLDNFYLSVLETNLESINKDYWKTPLYGVIEQFLKDLNMQCENITDIIKTFEAFIQRDNQWPQFTKHEISFLFLGDHYIKGILYYIGILNRNILGAQWCLRFFSKLINYESNPDCESFISIFRSLPIEILKQMKLNEHIRSTNTTILEDCFKILRIYLDDEITYKSFESIVKDEIIYQKFINWLEV